jgi:FtsZ-interacting cell division protein ZipA
LNTLIERKSEEENLKQILNQIHQPQLQSAFPQTNLPSTQLNTPVVQQVEEEEKSLHDEKEWITNFQKLTLEQDEKTREYYHAKKRELEQEKISTEEVKSRLLAKKKATEDSLVIKLNVGGQEFSANISVFANHRECIFNEIFKLGQKKQGEKTFRILYSLVHRCVFHR